jgi:hypothetical protein
MKLFEFKNFNDSFNIEIKRFDDFIETKIISISDKIKLQLLTSLKIEKWIIDVGKSNSFLDLDKKILFLNDKEFTDLKKSEITFKNKGDLDETMNELIEFSIELEKI